MEFKKVVLIFIGVVLLSSCTAFKKVNEKETVNRSTETETEKTYRAGDTVIYKVPVVTFKDTTIYTYNSKGSAAVVRYNDVGVVDSLACITSALDTFTQINKELVNSIIERDKEVKTDSTGWIWLAFGCFALVFLCLFGYVIWRLKVLGQVQKPL